MKNESALFKNFRIDRNGIKLIERDITEEEFKNAVKEYIHLISFHQFKLGDFLDQFRECFGRPQDHLIPHLVYEERQTKANLAKLMSLSSHYRASERHEELDEQVYVDVQSIKDRKLREKLISRVLTAVRAGEKVPITRVREWAREAKIQSGQGIRPNRGNPAVK